MSRLFLVCIFKHSFQSLQWTNNGFEEETGRINRGMPGVTVLYNGKRSLDDVAVRVNAVGQEVVKTERVHETALIVQIVALLLRIVDGSFLRIPFGDIC